jgi:predicted DNA-binding mobile mystery protein A
MLIKQGWNGMPEKTSTQAIVDWFEQSQPLSENGEGWIRSVRRQQSLQGKQLAERMQVSPARISVLEKDEQRGAVTLKMMQKAAEALDCRFVYALVPKGSSPQPKPRIRLDASTLRSDGRRQLQELELEYQRCLAETASD